MSCFPRGYLPGDLLLSPAADLPPLVDTDDLDRVPRITEHLRRAGIT
jgi:hypothetical protein